MAMGMGLLPLMTLLGILGGSALAVLLLLGAGTALRMLMTIMLLIFAMGLVEGMVRSIAHRPAAAPVAVPAVPAPPSATGRQGGPADLPAV